MRENMKAFQTSLSSKLKSNLYQIGYESFSPIQEQTITEIRNGKDVLLLAPTGSGKTITYVLPIVEKINSDSLQAMVLVPTRELAIQVRDLFRSLFGNSDIKCSVLFGGTNQKSQMEILKKKVSILIMTPGKAAELIQRKQIKMESLRTIVLDEVDQLLKQEMKHDIERIFSHIEKNVQIVLCSATNHQKIDSFTNQYCKDITIIKDTISNKKDITQQYYWVEKNQKEDLFFDLIKKEHIDHALIFTSTIERANTLLKTCLEYGISAEKFHHDIGKDERKKLMKKINSQDSILLITTDIAARGIDIPALPYVIQYDAPKDPATYVHRIGRTGRHHNTGKSIIFFTKEEVNFKNQIEHFTNQKITNKTKKKEITSTKVKSKNKKKHSKNIGKRKKK